MESIVNWCRTMAKDKPIDGRDVERHFQLSSLVRHAQPISNGSSVLSPWEINRTRTRKTNKVNVQDALTVTFLSQATSIVATPRRTRW
jgi:hypothetical protein